MPSRQPILSPLPLPVPKLKRARGQVSRLSHQHVGGPVRDSSLPIDQVEHSNLDSGYGHRRTNTTHGADHMGDADAHPRSDGPVSPSRDPRQPPDPTSLTVELSSSRAGSERGPDQVPHSRKRKRIRVSSPQSSPTHRGDEGQSSHIGGGEVPFLTHTGSWCHLTSKEPADEDILANVPITPRDSRLSTPDLSPLCTDFEFCPCHLGNVEEDGKIGQDFYFVSRSKMDMQIVEALAHIAQTKSGSGS